MAPRCLLGLGLLLCLALPVRAADPVIAAAGDIACDPADPNYNGGLGNAAGCQMKATSDLLVGAGYTAVLVLGDNQYEDGALAKFQQSYHPTWGRLKAITRPVPGNHDYANGGSNGEDYYAYFGASAGDPAKGWYSYDLGDWHLVALNSNCGSVGGCGAGSPQEAWLAADLAAVSGKCILAYWHHPRFSSGLHGDDPAYDAFWRALYRAGADVVLVGHEHDYERFHRQNPAGEADTSGIRQFIVGSGGKNLRPFATVRPNSAVRNNTDHGVLRLVLRPDRYEWQFLGAPGGAVLDSGSTACHRRTAPRGGEFHTLPPCRVFDTRISTGIMGAGSTRTFPVAGGCGIPAAARAVTLNVTGIQPTTSGSLRLFPAGGTTPITSVLRFHTGQIRAVATVSGLGEEGQLTLVNNSAGEIHVAVDVSGYFLE